MFGLLRIGSDWWDFVRSSCGQEFYWYPPGRQFERLVRSLALGSPSPIGWERAGVRVGLKRVVRCFNGFHFPAK
jgi:hypothetical protein